MISQIHSSFLAMNAPHQPAHPHMRSRMAGSLFQVDLGDQDGCKQSSQHDDLALGHEETNRRPQPDTWLMMVTPRRVRGLILLASVLNSVACFYTTGLLSLARGFFFANV